MKKIIAVLLFLTLSVLCLSVLPVHGEEGIYDSVIRLHVLANSDGEEDQALKLKVRDAVLARAGELLAEVDTLEEAETVLAASLDDLARHAAACLAENGSAYPVRVTLGREQYPTRYYEKLAFPAGEYLSLRVLIGEGAGQNWWCVLFPPLCLSAATAKGDTTPLAAGLTEEQYRMITESSGNTKYKLRFKVLETAKEWME